MFWLLFTQFLRSRTCQLGLGILLTLGLISLLIGRQFYQNQDSQAQEVAAVQEEHIARNVALHQDDLGLLLYYLKFTLVNPTHPLSALSIGQKDIHPSIQQVSILTLEGQRYNTDLFNPSKLLYGNLDFSFLLIYVFPLLIIAFTYNLLSEETESGTWKMVNVMSQSNARYILMKLLVRAIVLLGTMGILFLLAGLLLPIAWDAHFLAFFLTGLLYLLFWFGLSFWVVLLRSSSNVNAVALLSLWLLLVVLLPAMVNNRVTQQYPVPEAFTAMIQQRDGYHQKWDTNKRATMVSFYDSYPQLEEFGFPTEDGFTWHWYYAMQHLGDKESSTESAAMLAKIQERERLSSRWAQWIPSMHTQLAFNAIANTNLMRHLDFLQFIQEFHEETRLHFYPKVFSEAAVSTVNWDQFEPAHFEAPDTTLAWGKQLGPLLVATVIFFGLAAVFVRRLG